MEENFKLTVWFDSAGRKHWRKRWLKAAPLGPKRAAGTNPRAKGTSTRAKGTSPRSLGTNPRAQQ